jgi:hypothetical protein
MIAIPRLRLARTLPGGKEDASQTNYSISVPLTLGQIPKEMEQIYLDVAGPLAQHRA